ncbi:MAG: hypothetical protein CL840_16755 [Crocinitomicaceae bacterium]|nr:hypothetical protein [Crocinitomicaceae bacterium]|tara:strand:+ start:8090 stop:8512 length:423 start_codon:yes stop_codon:yes gene_type:complete
MRKVIFAIGVITLVVSCSVEPQPINYNLDVCSHCKMQITDSRYGTEIVTAKGKAFKFDSFECLIDYSKESEVEVGQFMVTSFDQPNVLINGKESWVIKCEKMPSPMGRYLTVFKTQDAAQSVIDELGGEMLPFDEALDQF